MGGYLVGLRNYREDLNPYLAEPSPMHNKQKLGGLGGGGKLKASKEIGGGMAAQLLYDQQLRILASLYGAPLRYFGVPQASAPPAADGLLAGGNAASKLPGVRGPPAGNGIAAAKAVRDGAGAGLGAQPESIS